MWRGSTQQLNNEWSSIHFTLRHNSNNNNNTVMVLCKRNIDKCSDTLRFSFWTWRRNLKRSWTHIIYGTRRPSTEAIVWKFDGKFRLYFMCEKFELHLTFYKEGKNYSWVVSHKPDDVVCIVHPIDDSSVGRYIMPSRSLQMTHAQRSGTTQ